MKRVVIYISDHGLGHAARQIGLIRKLKNIEIIIKNSNSYEFLRKSLPQIKIIKQRTDVGPTFDWRLNKINVKKTFLDYQNLISSQSKWIEKEKDFIKFNHINLIISDISPLALRLAEKTKSNVVSIANFSWIDIIEEFPDSKEKNDIINWLNESFSLSNLTIKLPLSMNLKGFTNIKNANLLYRNTTDSKKNILCKLGLKREPIVIYSGNYDITKKLHKQKKFDVDIISMQQDKIYVNGKKISQIFVEGQDLIAISRCVITKIGYSTIAEGLRYCKPMLLIPRDKYAEDHIIYENIKQYSIAKLVNYSNNKIIKVPDPDEIKEMCLNINKQKCSNLFDKQNADEFIKEFLLN